MSTALDHMGTALDHMGTALDHMGTAPGHHSMGKKGNNDHHSMSRKIIS
jgi:hypothetical protein